MVLSTLYLHSALFAPVSSILLDFKATIIIQIGNYYGPYFTKDKMETKRFNKLPEVTQPVSNWNATRIPRVFYHSQKKKIHFHSMNHLRQKQDKKGQGIPDQCSNGYFTFQSPKSQGTLCSFLSQDILPILTTENLAKNYGCPTWGSSIHSSSQLQIQTLLAKFTPTRSTWLEEDQASILPEHPQN